MPYCNKKVGMKNIPCRFISLLLLFLWHLDPICGFSNPVVGAKRRHPSIVPAVSTRSSSWHHPPILQALPITEAGAAVSLVDPTMAGYEMQAFEAYGTVTALAINAALFVYTDYPKDDNNDNGAGAIAKSLFMAASSLCIISGAFTVLLFTLLVIYGQSALGMGNEEGFALFWKEIDDYALLGFRSFLACIGSFIVAFLFSLRNKISEEDDPAGNFILAASVLLVVAGGFQIEAILSLATRLIFTPEFQGN